MTMSTYNIKAVDNFDLESDFIAEVVLNSGKTQKLDWASLDSLVNEGNEEMDFKDIGEHFAYSFTGEYFVISINWAYAQGGLVAIWNCELEKWVGFDYCEFVFQSLLIKERNLLISLCLVSDFLTPYSENLDIFQCDFQEGGRVEITHQELCKLESLEEWNGSRRLSEIEYKNCAVIAHEEGELGLYYLPNRSAVVIESSGALFKYPVNNLI
jgi:hypothetical protein